MILQSLWLNDRDAEPARLHSQGRKVHHRSDQELDFALWPLAGPHEGRRGPGMASTRREQGDVPDREGRPAIHFDRVLATHEGVIDLAQSIAIGEVTFDDEPWYRNGDALPPLYTAGLTIDAFFECFFGNIDPGSIARADRRRARRVGPLLPRPLHPAQTVTSGCSITGVTKSPAGILITTKMVVRDELAAPLGPTHLWTSIAIRGSTEFLGGEALPDHRFPAASREHLLGSETIWILTTDGEAYFKAAGDHAPHLEGPRGGPGRRPPWPHSAGHVHFRDRRRCRHPPCRWRLAEAPTPGHALQRTRAARKGPHGRRLRRANRDHRWPGAGLRGRQGDQPCLSHGRAEFGPAPL